MAKARDKPKMRTWPKLTAALELALSDRVARKAILGSGYRMPLDNQHGEYHEQWRRSTVTREAALREKFAGDRVCRLLCSIILPNLLTGRNPDLFSSL